MAAGLMAGRRKARAEAEAELSPSQLRECPGCGLLQTVPPMARGMTARCARCPTTLHKTASYPLDHSIALTFAALILLIITCSTVLMGVSTAGLRITANIFSGPIELGARHMPELGLVVVFVTVIAPFIKLSGTLYVLIRLREARPPAHLRRVFAIAEWLRPWTMIEVFVFGVFVAYVKLGDLVTITLQHGVFALLALTFAIIWADSALDREEVWERLAGRGAGAPRAPLPARYDEVMGCEICGFVAVPSEEGHCPRCGTHVHRRKPNSVARTWALVIAAAVMYIPANYFPVLTVMQLGAGAPSTILGGVEELVASKMYPLAALVFFASIAVPMMKLIGLTTMLVSIQTGRTGWLRDRTKLYHIVRWIGRWSMIDIFMEALLGALVKFGNAITIEPGIGADAFCAVVILTMLAAETFDPRLMWDSAERRSPAPSRNAAALPAA
ncbi:MAG: paraquat-inducible protein A [Dongiaceae bacterium]